MYTDKFDIENTADFKKFCEPKDIPLENWNITVNFATCEIEGGQLNVPRSFTMKLREGVKVVIKNVCFDNYILFIDGKGEIWFEDCVFRGAITSSCNANFNNCKFELGMYNDRCESELQHFGDHCMNSAYDFDCERVIFKNCSFAYENKYLITDSLFCQFEITTAIYERCKFSDFNISLFEEYPNNIEFIDCTFSELLRCLYLPWFRSK